MLTCWQPPSLPTLCCCSLVLLDDTIMHNVCVRVRGARPSIQPSPAEARAIPGTRRVGWYKVVAGLFCHCAVAFTRAPVHGTCITHCLEGVSLGRTTAWGDAWPVCFCVPVPTVWALRTVPGLGRTRL